ncbi:MAG: hypothetical protein LBT81_00680 [Helicobacteraceae bacterium]|jgi:hypothetical protein|nr:hypothetical protein [Helicobacteraceae bacterium]
MGGQVFLYGDFVPFLRHEIGEMRRLQEDQRKITIMFLQVKAPESGLKFLQGSLRTSDVIFHKGDAFLIVMPLTDKEGAMHVARVLEEYYGERVHDVNATWPEDGEDEGALLTNFAQYIRSKCGIDLFSLII